MISQSIWAKFKTDIPYKAKKLMAGTIETLFDSKTLVSMKIDITANFDNIKQSLSRLSQKARN
jgi:hypothetical protein